MTEFRSKRRRFLLLSGGGLAAAGAAVTYGRGVRFPTLRFVDAGPAMEATMDGVTVSAQGAVFQESREGMFRFRAFVPEPEFTVRSGGGRQTRIVVENIHPRAELEAGGSGAPDGAVLEERFNLSRSLALRSTAQGARFSWRFPGAERYRFAAIGDTGGGTELRWVLKRAAELGADFLLHLGDIYYEEGDFERAAVHLNTADVPTYAAIGNHDFHMGWEPLHPTFHRVVGPSNFVFTLGGVEFVNIDTAADFIPPARGVRARILGGLRPLDAMPDVRDRVVFTHAPLHDPDSERDHAVSRAGEARWLRERLLATGARNLLAGHIHIKEEFDDQGLHTYVSGQGLGHADLIGEIPYRRFAEILIGDVEPGEPVRYHWQPLNMPFEAHCSARNLGMLEWMGRDDVRATLMELCGRK
jgi:hypothetical protein